MCDVGLSRSVSCEDIKASIALPIIVEHEEQPLIVGQYFHQKRQQLEDAFKKMRKETHELNERINTEVEQIIQVANEEIKLIQNEMLSNTCNEITSIEQWLLVSDKYDKQNILISKVTSELAADLKFTEQSRSEGITKILSKYKEEVTNAGNTCTADIERFFEEEIKKINLNVVKAFRRYEDVNLQLQIKGKNSTDECRIKLKNIARTLAGQKAKQLWDKIQERQRKNMLTEAIYNLSQEKFKIRRDFTELANNLANGLSGLAEGLQLPAEYDLGGDYWDSWIESLNARLLVLDSHCKNVQMLLTTAISSLLEKFDDEINQFSVATGITLRGHLEDSKHFSEVESELDEFRRCQAQELSHLQTKWQDTINVLNEKINRSKTFVLDLTAIWINHSARVKKLYDDIENKIMKSYETSLKKHKEKDTKIKGFIKTVREANDVTKLKALCEILKEKFHEQVIELENSYDSQLEMMEDMKRKGVEELIKEKQLEINNFLNKKYPKKKLFFPQYSLESADSIKTSDNDTEMVSQINVCETYMSAVENRTLGMYEMLERYYPYVEASVAEETEEWLNMFMQDIVNNYDSQVIELDESQSKTLKDIKQIRFAELHIHANRLVSHVQGAKHEFSEINKWFEKVKSNQNEYLNEFNKKVSSKLTKGISKCPTKIIMDLEQEWNCLFDSLKTCIFEGRNLCDNKYQEVKEANHLFLKTAKNFKDGGNYSPEELKTLNRELSQLMKYITSQYKTQQKNYDDLSKTISRQVLDSRIQQVNEELKHLELQNSVKDALSTLRVRLRMEIDTIKKKNKAVNENIVLLASSTRIDPQLLNNTVKLVKETQAYMVFPEDVNSLECTKESKNSVVSVPMTIKTDKSKKSVAVKQSIDQLFKHTTRSIFNDDNNFLTCTKGLMLKNYDHLLQYIREASKSKPSEVVKPTTASPSKLKDKKQDLVSDVANEQINLVRHALLSYNFECELVWLSQTREFLDLVTSMKRNFNAVAESQLSNTRVCYLRCLHDLERRFVINRDKEELKKEKERELMQKRLVLPLAHPSNHEKLKILQQKAKEMCHVQIKDGKDLLQKYKNDLQYNYDSYVNTVRTSKDDLIALQTALFDEDLCKTLVDNTKGIRDVIPYSAEIEPLSTDPAYAYPCSIWSGGNDDGDDSHTPRSIGLIILPTSSNTSCHSLSAAVGHVDKVAVNKIAVQYAQESAVQSQQLYEQAKETQELNEKAIQRWINEFQHSVKEAQMIYS